MGKSLSPRDAAEALGISPDTLRRWERDGLIASNRTPGGQRRYDEVAVLALLDRKQRPAQRAQPSFSRSNPHELRVEEPEVAFETYTQDVPTYERRVREEKANLEVIKLRLEQTALLRAQATQREQSRREMAENQRLANEQKAERESRTKNDEVERERLERIRSHGRAQSIGAPAEHQARVARDLLSSVTAHEYPAEMPIYLAYAQISARVNQVLKPWRDTQEKERQDRDAQSRIAEVTLSARWYALAETRDLDSAIRGRVQREIERALKNEVEEDWSADNAKDLVDEILDDWCD